eukprot:909160-Rhodomonas_salina.1
MIAGPDNERGVQQAVLLERREDVSNPVILIAQHAPLGLGSASQARRIVPQIGPLLCRPCDLGSCPDRASGHTTDRTPLDWDRIPACLGTPGNSMAYVSTGHAELMQKIRSGTRLIPPVRG